MARITIEDCLNRVPNRFVLVHMVAQRVRQIREGSEYLVSSPKNEDIVVALREIAAGKVFLRRQRSMDAPVPESTALSAKPTPPSRLAASEPASLKALDAAKPPSEKVAEGEAPQAEDMAAAGEATEPAPVSPDAEPEPDALPAEAAEPEAMQADAAEPETAPEPDAESNDPEPPAAEPEDGETE